MPTTRAARAAARAAARLLIELPADVLGLVLYHLTLAHDIAAVAPTCHALDYAAKLAMKLRPFSREVLTLAVPDEPEVNCVAALPDGRVITGSFDEAVKVWRDGAWERTILAHGASVEAVAVLPGGARFVSGAYDATAKLWTIDGALERTFEVGGSVLCVAALPDGEHFVVSVGDDDLDRNGPYEVRLYHVDGTLVHAFIGHTNDVNAVMVTPDGRHIISGSEDGLVKVWSVAGKSLVCTCTGVGSCVRAVAPMPDGKRILSGANDRSVRVHLLDGARKNIFELHEFAVTALVALPDNQHALSGSWDRTVKLFNVNDGAVLRTFWHHTLDITSLALLPDGLRFVSGSEDETARIVYHGLAPHKIL